MNPATLLLILILLAMMSLLIVSAVNQRQTRSRLIARRLIQMKRRVEELDEMALSLDRFVESPYIAVQIIDEAVDMIHSMQKLDPGSQPLEVSLQNAERLADELRNPSRNREIYRLLESDAAIARALYQMNDSGRILRKRQARGRLEMAQMESYIQELSWAHMMVGVVSNVGQGHKALNRGDVLKAYAFYKKAQQVAIQTSNSDERRHKLIKELSDILANRRKFLSLEFMPESEYNPSVDAESLPSGMAGQTIN